MLPPSNVCTSATSVTYEATLCPLGSSIPCNSSFIYSPSSPSLTRNFCSRISHPFSSHCDGALPHPTTLPRLRFPIVFTFPPPPEFRFQQPQPGCSTIPPSRAGEVSNSIHVPHSTSSLSIAHSYLANSSPPQHTDSLACSHYPNSHGHYQSPPSGVGDDEPNGGPTITITITTTLTFSLSRSSSLFPPLSHLQLPARRRAYVLSGTAT